MDQYNLLHNNYAKHNKKIVYRCLIFINNYSNHSIWSWVSILKLSNTFPGIVLKEPNESINDLPYLIDTPVNLKKLYLMLPKEKIYTMSDTFTQKYTWSKIRELLYLFYCLRAKTMTFTYFNHFVSDENHYDMIEYQLHLYYIKIKNKTAIHDMDDPTHCEGIQYELEFHNNYRQINTSDFVEGFYYLKHNCEWQILLYNRLAMNVVEEFYNYKNITSKLLKNKAIKSLNKNGMDIKSDWEEYCDCYVKCKVQYYDQSLLN